MLDDISYCLNCDVNIVMCEVRIFFSFGVCCYIEYFFYFCIFLFDSIKEYCRVKLVMCILLICVWYRGVFIYVRDIFWKNIDLIFNIIGYVMFKWDYWLLVLLFIGVLE